MNQKHKYKLLEDKVELDDKSENGTHRAIAQGLFNLINDNDSGFSVGLEGSWGAGKSTIISIFKKQLEKDTKNIFYFYFDAWGHEGDPLRRIFLEKLIQEIPPDKRSEVLEDLSKKVSNREKVVTTKTTQSATSLGKWLTVTAFFVPLGAAIISNTSLVHSASFLVFLASLSSPLTILQVSLANWFWLALLLCCAPLIVLILNLLRLFYKKYQSKGVSKIFDSKHWSFLEKESTGTSTQEVSESEERSSIEFEKYFKEILGELEKQESKKVLIVIDNLDRVDPEDSLKIWSTLQTFFQHRNPSSQSSLEIQRKLWLIVPYDREGLVKLWDKEFLNKPEDDYKSVSKSFFDKCFQLIIPVPPLTHNAWEAFLISKLDESFSFEQIGTTESQKSFKADVINIFKNTRKSATDIPSYREIINFVNQVNWLKASVNEEISNKAIAYFAIDKYIRFKSKDEIIKSLISDEGETFNLEHKKHIAGIIYGVSPETGMEILLDKEVAKYWGESESVDNLQKDKLKNELIKLESKFREAFWTQLGIFLRLKGFPNLSFNDLLSFSSFIYPLLGQSKGKYELSSSFISNHLKPLIYGAELNKYLPKLHYLLKWCNSEYGSSSKIDFDSLIESFISCISNWNSISEHPQTENIYLALIELLKLGCDLSKLVHHVHFLTYVNNNLKFIKYPALLYLAFNTSNGQPLTSQTPLLRSFWREENDSNNEDLDFIFEHLEFIDNFEALWNLFNDSDYIQAIKLISRVIQGFDGEKYSKIFSNQPLDKLNKLISYSKDEEEKKKFCEFFIKNTEIQNDLLDESLEVIKYDKPVYCLIKTFSLDKNPKFFENLKQKVKDLSKDQWKVALDGETNNSQPNIYLISLAIAFQRKDANFTLESQYHDALLDFAKDLLSGQRSLSESQKENIKTLKELLNKSFQQRFDEQVIEYITENLSTLSKNSLESCKELINFTQLASGREFENYVESTLENIPPVADLEKILYIYDNAEKITPLKDFKIRINDRIENLLPKQDLPIQTLLNQISEKIGNQTP